MTHLTPDELFRYVHGLLDDPEDALAQAHLESCLSCAGQAGRLRAERAVLEDACSDSRPPQEEVHAMTALVASLPAAPARPAPRPRFASMSLGLTLAASVLGAFVAGSFFLSQQAPLLPPAQERPAGPLSEEARLRRLAREFLGDDEAARLAAKAELLKAGHLSIRILLEERQGRPPAIFHRASDLLFTLRFLGENSSKGRDFRLSMSKREFSDYDERSLPLFRLFYSFAVLAEKDHVIDLPSPEASDGLADYQVLDLVFDSMGLDYAFRFGHLLVARPEDLWPFPAPEKGNPDPDSLRRHLGRLDSAVLADRDDAERAIRGMGTWVLESLRTQVGSGSAEFQARVRKLVATIEGRSKAPRFRPECAMDAQLLTAKGEAVRFRLKSHRVSVSLGAFAGNRLDVALLRAEELKGAGHVDMTRTLPAIKCSDFLADLHLDRRIESSGQPEASLRDVLILVTRLAPDGDLDLCIVEGEEPHVRIATREEIAKIVAAQNAAREAERTDPEGAAK